MAKTIAQLKIDLKAAQNEEFEAGKAVEGSENDADKNAAQELLSSAVQKKQAIEAEIKKLEADAKAKKSKSQNQSNDKSDKKTGPVFEVSAASSRRRAGMKFGPVPVKVNRGDLTDKQWEAIDHDPLLKVATAK